MFSWYSIAEHHIQHELQLNRLGVSYYFRKPLDLEAFYALKVALSDKRQIY